MWQVAFTTFFFEGGKIPSRTPFTFFLILFSGTDICKSLALFSASLFNSDCDGQLFCGDDQLLNRL